MKILKKNLAIPSCSKATITRADDLFVWIDPDFEKYGTDIKSPKTESVNASVLEIEKDGTFKDIFTSVSSDLDSLCLTQAQIIEFVKNHKSELRQDGYSTFFLFKVGDEFFVANVRVRSDGLRASVRRFSGGSVWYAKYRHRVVVPQLALKNSDPSPSDTLTLETLQGEELEKRLSRIESWIRKEANFINPFE